MLVSKSLIVRVPNWLGDVVMTLPALNALHAAGIKLVLIGKPWLANLMQDTGFSCIAGERSFSKRLYQLYQIPVKDMLLITNSLSSSILARLSGKRVCGYATDYRGLLLSYKLPKPQGLHEAEIFWRIAAFAAKQYWQIDLGELPKSIKLPISVNVMENIDNLLEKHRVYEPYLVLCPGAIGKGENGESKIWPYWQDLAKNFSHEFKIVICPAKNEEESFRALLPEAVLLPNLNLKEYAAVCAKSFAVIANDSGPMHLAAAVHNKVIGIFGVTEPGRTAPLGGIHLGSLGSWPQPSDVIDKFYSSFV
jgi:heptosyltransferase II